MECDELPRHANLVFPNTISVKRPHRSAVDVIVSAEELHENCTQGQKGR